jgi:hypothetical protein
MDIEDGELISPRVRATAYQEELYKQLQEGRTIQAWAYKSGNRVFYSPGPRGAKDAPEEEMLGEMFLYHARGDPEFLQKLPKLFDGDPVYVHLQYVESGLTGAVIEEQKKTTSANHALGEIRGSHRSYDR